MFFLKLANLLTTYCIHILWSFIKIVSEVEKPFSLKFVPFLYHCMDYIHCTWHDLNVYIFAAAVTLMDYDSITDISAWNAWIWTRPYADTYTRQYKQYSQTSTTGLNIIWDSTGQYICFYVTRASAVCRWDITLTLHRIK